MAINRKEKLLFFIKSFDIQSNPLTLLEFKKLFDEVKEDFPNIVEESLNWPTDEKELADELLLSIFWKELSVFENYILRWEKGLFVPNEEELRELKKYQNNFPEVISFFVGLIEKSSSPRSLEEEKQVAEKNKEKLDKLLKNDEYRQKAEELLKKYKDNSPFSDDDNSNKDIENKFNEQINNLQNQIRDLENKQNQDSSLEKDHKYKKELERLKKELEELKRRGQKTSPTSPEKKNDNFPYGLVIGGLIIIVIVVLLAFFYHKRTNK